MSRTQKTYKHSKFAAQKTWQQISLKLCTMCGTRCCGDPITIDGMKSKKKCKGTHKDKYSLRHTMDDKIEPDFDEEDEEP